MAYTRDRFDTLRKPNGRPYNSNGNLKRSVMCSLTSNGVFQKIEPQQAKKQPPVARDMNKELWRVNEERANEYFVDMRQKLEGTK